jgi:hypothetical protein
MGIGKPREENRNRDRKIVIWRVSAVGWVPVGITCRTQISRDVCEFCSRARIHVI